MNRLQLFKAIGLLALITAASIWLGCAGPPKPPQDERRDFTKQLPRLSPGDNVTIRLDTATSREEHLKTVDEKGDMLLPLVGKVNVQGQTPSEAEETIHKAYVPKYYSVLTVTVQTQTQRVVYMVGEVKQSGSLAYRDDLTVYRAIVLAGGFTEFANRRKVILTRGDKRFTVDWVKIDLRQQPDVPVLPGDTIKVEKSWP